VNDNAQSDVSFHGIDTEFNITELYILMPKKGTTTGADSYEEVKKVLLHVNIPVHNWLAWWRMERQVWLGGTVACLRLSPAT
jgi:hypothetical protein